MQDLVQSSNHVLPEKNIRFIFSSPISSVEDRRGHGIIEIVHNNQKIDHIEFDLLIECTGFKQNQAFEEITQDEAGKFVTDDQYCLKNNIYSCGWARTGPKGNIADSIAEASNCARSIFTDLMGRGRNKLDDLPASTCIKFTLKNKNE